MTFVGHCSLAAEPFHDLRERPHRGVQPIGGAAADDVRNGITEINVAM